MSSLWAIYVVELTLRIISPFCLFIADQQLEKKQFRAVLTLLTAKSLLSSYVIIFRNKNVILKRFLWFQKAYKENRKKYVLKKKEFA